MNAEPMTEHKPFYLPSLDGLRAVAATLVFLGHAGWGHIFPGGFGVTIFFFLSGYLITTLLRREYERGQGIHVGHFYLRRVYRILPPMYLVLLGVWLLSAMGLLGQPPSAAGAAAQVLQLTNYYILHAGEAGLVPYTATFWSLAVEEHFYLLFPMLFIACIRRQRYPAMARTFALICGAILLWRCVLIFGWQLPGARTYLASDTRLDSLLFGCIMGVWMNPALDPARAGLTRARQVGVLLAALALLLLTFVLRDEAFRATLRYTLQGVALFPVFWLAVRHPQWPAFRWLNSWALRWLGKISYVFYLSHLFWLGVLASVLPARPVLVAVAAFAATVVFSLLVYRVLEQPLARLRRRL
ncbi:MAG: acyltransferase [Pseudomonadota bacterium]